MMFTIIERMRAKGDGKASDDPFLTAWCVQKMITCSSRRAFVTGGGGYVGSSLCRRLSERGYAVVAFDLQYPEDIPTDSIHRIKV